MNTLSCKNTYNLAEPEPVLILDQIHFLKFGGKSQPQRSYKNGSYKIKSVLVLNTKCIQSNLYLEKTVKGTSIQWTLL